MSNQAFSMKAKCRDAQEIITLDEVIDKIEGLKIDLTGENPYTYGLDIYNYGWDDHDRKNFLASVLRNVEEKMRTITATKEPLDLQHMLRALERISLALQQNDDLEVRIGCDYLLEYGQHMVNELLQGDLIQKNLKDKVIMLGNMIYSNVGKLSGAKGEDKLKIFSKIQNDLNTMQRMVMLKNKAIDELTQNELMSKDPMIEGQKVQDEPHPPQVVNAQNV
jgi:hypothetical protein